MDWYCGIVRHCDNALLRVGGVQLLGDICEGLWVQFMRGISEMLQVQLVRDISGG